MESMTSVGKTAASISTYLKSARTSEETMYAIEGKDDLTVRIVLQRRSPT